MQMTLKYNTEQVTKKYEIGNEILGVGVSGKVRECSNKKTGKKYAIKILPDDAKSRREARLHHISSEHINIAKLYEVYQNKFNGAPSLLLIMELLRGGELFERIKDRKTASFTEREASNIIHSISSAVFFLHKNNIAHRDLKPENLIYSEPGEKGILKLCDFGFARSTEDIDAIDPSPEIYSFTPNYSSPEVLCHEKYDRSCDIWAIGVITYILYYCMFFLYFFKSLSGYPPFTSSSGQPISPGMKERIKAGKYHMIGPEWDRVSEAAKDLIRKCLNPDSSRRITAEEIMSHKWISYYNKNPIIPLATVKKFDERGDNLFELSVIFQDDGMEHALATMRVDNVKLKDIDDSKNPLLERRRSRSNSLLQTD